jgi:hypothetical protein
MLMNFLISKWWCFLTVLTTCIQPAEKTIIAATNKEQAQAFSVASNFEGGSARVLAIDPVTQTVRITPAGDSARGMPVWWYFRIDGIDVHKPVILEVVANEAVMHTDVPGKTAKIPPAVSLPVQATFSTDGKAWLHTEPGTRHDNRMVYQLHPNTSSVWLAWGPPFTASDAVHFVESTAGKYTFAKAFTLCLSRENRQVPALQISEGNKPAAQRPAIWVQARQHAWECGSSWVATGFTGWLVSDDEQAKQLRQQAEIFVVPVMDIDHVATGDGGKNAIPQDHNRDWTEAPHWKEVAATQKHILRLAKEERLSIFLDLHNPGPAGRQLAIYVMNKEHVGAAAPPLQEQFLTLINKTFGSYKRNESKPPVLNAPIFFAVSEPWVAAHGNPATIAFCVETPWNVPQGTVEGYQTVGKKIAQTVAAYQLSPDRP